MPAAPTTEAPPPVYTDVAAFTEAWRPTRIDSDRHPVIVTFSGPAQALVDLAVILSGGRPAAGQTPQLVTNRAFRDAPDVFYVGGPFAMLVEPGRNTYAFTHGGWPTKNWIRAIRDVPAGLRASATNLFAATRNVPQPLLRMRRVTYAFSGEPADSILQDNCEAALGFSRPADRTAAADWQDPARVTPVLGPWLFRRHFETL